MKTTSERVHELRLMLASKNNSIVKLDKEYTYTVYRLAGQARKIAKRSTMKEAKKHIEHCLLPLDNESKSIQLVVSYNNAMVARTIAEFLVAVGYMEISTFNMLESKAGLDAMLELVAKRKQDKEQASQEAEQEAIEMAYCQEEISIESKERDTMKSLRSYHNDTIKNVAIVSACLATCSQEENNHRDEIAQNMLKGEGIAFKLGKGVYQGTEELSIYIEWEDIRTLHRIKEIFIKDFQQECILVRNAHVVYLDYGKIQEDIGSQLIQVAQWEAEQQENYSVFCNRYFMVK